MKKLQVFLTVMFFAILTGGVVLWFQSPYIFAGTFVTAIETNDYAKLRRVIDIHTFRGEALDAMARIIPAALRQVARQMGKGPDADQLSKYPGQVFSRYAVSPEGVSSLLNGRGVLPADVVAKLPTELLIRRTMVSSNRYGETYDVFHIKFVAKETGEEVDVLLARSGWFLWKAVKIDSKHSLFLPFKLPQSWGPVSVVSDNLKSQESLLPEGPECWL